MITFYFFTNKKHQIIPTVQSKMAHIVKFY